MDSLPSAATDAFPDPPRPDDPERGYMARVAREVLPRVRARLGGT